MTENRRIFINIVATYGRSLYSLVLGLLCGRWTLMSLGEVDYGLWGLVGGLVVFISFFNTVLAGANARFYSFSIGAAKVAEDKELALEECRRWFNTAVSIHCVVPFLLLVLGYPIGVYTIEHWLNIPPDRMIACIWVFRFTCFSCFVSMLNVPFTAMYDAKQYIAELTIYSFITATLNAGMLYFMVTHPGEWLSKFAAWTCFLSVVPQLIICVRAIQVFPECRIRVSYMWDISRLRQIGFFSGWQFLGVLCGLLRTQGLSIVINKFFGAAMNAAQAVGNSVQGHCNTLAGAMQAAFVPVITQACGAGDYRRMNTFVIRTSKFNVLLTLIFVLPLAAELPEVMRLWLKQPPAYAVGLCYFAMVLHLVDSSTTGHYVAINATGRIAAFHAVVCAVNVFTIPLAVLAGLWWHNVYAVMIAVIIMTALHSCGRLVFARIVAKTDIWAWVGGVALPLLVSSIICGGIGLLPHMVMRASFLRICMTTLCCELAFIPLVWFLILSNEERCFVKERILTRIFRVIGR